MNDDALIEVQTCGGLVGHWARGSAIRNGKILVTFPMSVPLETLPRSVEEMDRVVFPTVDLAIAVDDLCPESARLLFSSVPDVGP